MNVRVDHVGTDVNAELADSPDAKSVTQQSQRDDRQGQAGAPPRALQEKIASYQAGDEKDKRRVDPAALRRYVHPKTWKLKARAFS
jgi:hypothetical protein